MNNGNLAAARVFERRSMSTGRRRGVRCRAARSLSMPPTAPRSTCRPAASQRVRKLDDVLLPSAYARRTIGPGDPEAQVAAARCGRSFAPGAVRRRHFNGRSYDLLKASAAGRRACRLRGRDHGAARRAGGSRSRAGADHARRLARCAPVSRPFAPDRTLLLHNPRFGELIGLPPERLRRGLGFADLLDADADARGICRAATARLHRRPAGPRP